MVPSRSACQFCAPDEPCALCSGLPEVLDLDAQVELRPARLQDRRWESSRGDALLHGLVGDAPFACKIRRRREPACLPDRGSCSINESLRGLLHGTDNNISGCMLTTRSRVDSIQPMKTTAHTDTAESIKGFTTIKVGKNTYPVISVRRYPELPAGFVNGHGRAYPKGQSESYLVRYNTGKRELVRYLENTDGLS